MGDKRCETCAQNNAQFNRCLVTHKPNAVREYRTDPTTQETALHTLKCDKYTSALRKDDMMNTDYGNIEDSLEDLYQALEDAKTHIRIWVTESERVEAAIKSHSTNDQPDTDD